MSDNVDAPEPLLPARFGSPRRLGGGGGGEVWAVSDRATGEVLALKLLAEDASSAEMEALVREAVALSGLEGLGLPRVLRFGRLPRTGRAYLLRELIDGQSLGALAGDGAPLGRLVEALADAATRLGQIHRAGLLHGDIKPDNIIVGPHAAVPVDLGLAAPFLERGAEARGLTPRFAAPELLAGGPLTVRAEVYSLGATLAELLVGRNSVPAELRAVGVRATLLDPQRRYPSADEFASALRGAAGLAADAVRVDQFFRWSIIGVDACAERLTPRVARLAPGERLAICGDAGSGRSILLRRLGWGLGVGGARLAWVDVPDAALLRAELSDIGELAGSYVLVDDADELTDEAAQLLADARAGGARVVEVRRDAPLTERFDVPALGPAEVRGLALAAVPSLSDAVVAQLQERTRGRPGVLRSLLQRLADEPVASTHDIARVISSLPSTPPADPLREAERCLDHGRFRDAERWLDHVDGSTQRGVLARARLLLGLGQAAAALAALRGQTAPPPELSAPWAVAEGRALMATGAYAEARATLAAVAGEGDAMALEATAYLALATSYGGQDEEAAAALLRAAEVADTAGWPRPRAVALASLGVVRQRREDVDGAREAYRAALDAAELASDAALLATTRLNLAGVEKMRGDLAAAIEHFEAAVDLGRRSGRRSIVWAALLNLANLDVYLGRVSRADERLTALEAEREALSDAQRAQLEGVRAERLARERPDQALASYERCAAGFRALGRAGDAAEAELEAVLVRCRLPGAEPEALAAALERTDRELGDALAHRPLWHLAAARVALLRGDSRDASAHADSALGAAERAGLREWIWRALALRAEVTEASGQSVAPRRDREAALAVLEEIAARLPADLREVYWDDARRRDLQRLVTSQLAKAPTEFRAAPSYVTRFPGSGGEPTSAEQRLRRILAINAELARERDAETLPIRIVDHAVGLLRAERGLLILAEDGDLRVAAQAPTTHEPAAIDFSRSVARRVLESGEPLVSTSPQTDDVLRSARSVHQLMLQSVACVPVRAPDGRAVGALYLETRAAPAGHFHGELEALLAFADQAAIAIQTARLLAENRRRAEELARANAELSDAQERLKEALGDRTEQLREARKRLRETRAELRDHFGYRGLVGTSPVMRRVYAIIERVKDTDVPVLITGESGTGKEMVAKAIHASSPRAKARFLGVNCGAIPESLLESELFGHVRGAFTGADKERKGLFRECDGGTVLLDEVGEMPTKMQAGLLRVLQERRVRPVGGSSEETVDVRLVFATHRDLARMVSAGTFREDLFYRVQVVEIRLPSLRERPEDIPQLVHHFMGRFAARYARERKIVSRDAMRLLQEYDWPGNVRQLENVLLNAWVMGDDEELIPEDFTLPTETARRPPTPAVSPVHAHPHAAVPPPAAASAPAAPAPPKKISASQHRRDEKQRILEALQDCNWNRVRAAQIVGIPRRTFYRRLREYGIQ